MPESLEAPELRQLFGFYDRIRERTGAEPSLADMERILRIQKRVQALGQLERLNALTREPAANGGR